MTLFQALGVFASAGGGAAAAPGMVLLTPTSIAYSGTSASVGANGQVTFSAVTSLSLNGVFSAGFDNYVITSNVLSSATPSIYIRLRASGTDATTGYTNQYLLADSTTVSAARTTAVQGLLTAGPGSSFRDLEYVTMYGPYLAQPTAQRSVTIADNGGVVTFDIAATHSTSSSYDGFTYYSGSAATLTGKLAVYGVRS